MLKCWCKKCGKRLKTKREYISQEDTCDDCFKLPPKPKKKVIKEWALVDIGGNIATCFSPSHSVFMPRIYKTKEGAERVAEIVITGAERLKVVSCEITLNSL